MSELENVDLTAITPDEFAALVKETDDEQLVAAIRMVGVGQTLDRIFEGFEERFRPDRAKGVQARIQFAIQDEDTHHYRLEIADGSCSAEPGQVDDPRVTLRLDLLPFLHLITGQAQGPMLFMKRKLKIDGDLMFASRIMNFFDAPTA